MSQARERFHHGLSRPTYTVAANIFDPLSARIAHMWSGTRSVASLVSRF